MDARIMAYKKGTAMTRIENGLAELGKLHGYQSDALSAYWKNYRDPELAVLRRIELIADLVELITAIAADPTLVEKPADAEHGSAK